jgi:hypothetical protein
MFPAVTKHLSCDGSAHSFDKCQQKWTGLAVYILTALSDSHIKQCFNTSLGIICKKHERSLFFLSFASFSPSPSFFSRSSVSYRSHISYSVPRFCSYSNFHSISYSSKLPSHSSSSSSSSPPPAPPHFIIFLRFLPLLFPSLSFLILFLTSEHSNSWVHLEQLNCERDR